MPERLLRDWTDSEAVDQLSWQAECLFVRLIMKADDFGRYHGNPKLLRSLLFPLKDGLRDADISRWIAECETAGLLRVYTDKVSGKPFIEIRKFGQRLRTKKAKFPDENGNLSASCSKMQQSAEDCSNPPQNAAECGRMRLEEEVEVEDNHTHRVRACDDPCLWSYDAPTLLGDLLTDWERWLSVWSDMHGNGRPMNEIIQQAQLEKLMRLPAEVRRDALKAAIAGGWKNIQDIRESGPVKRKGGRNKPDIAEPPAFTAEDRDDDIDKYF